MTGIYPEKDVNLLAAGSIYTEVDVNQLPGIPGQRGPTGPQGAPSTVPGPTGPTGPQGPQGSFGGATFEYLFSLATIDTDPGAGYLAFDANPFSGAAHLYISATDLSMTDVSGFLETIDDSTSSIKGTFKVFNKLNDTQYAYFSNIGLHYKDVTYYEVPVAFVSGSITSMSASEHLGITFARTGDIGDTGPTGPTGPQGNPGVVPTFVMQDAVVVRTGVSRFYFESSRTITKVRASVNTAPVGAALAIALNINGTLITTVSIAAGTNTATATLSQAVNLNDYATIDVTSVGSTTPGSDLIVTLTIN